ncbi:hypothetical protein [Leptospira kirschneri]|uniref:hypothetical protein n=1 Tax=Leptospira kirschneri TaxID=29507 RepID=UPI0002926FBB|nr:hypothetical protein [Leptospira kirschneri]EKO62691.1 hypothetical protein LEP1GSC082_4591 [Leptospira kirschneri str. H2]
MVQVDKKERKLKKSEEKQIQKIVELLEANPDAILWIELILYKFLESQKDKDSGSLKMEDFKNKVLESMKSEKKVKPHVIVVSKK